MSSPRIDKNADRIQRMFAGVAPRYDFLNHLLSGSLDRLWRRRVVQALNADAGVWGAPNELGRDGAVLDLCCGTGDQAISLRADGRKVLAADFCVPMLALARSKFEGLVGGRPALLAADALRLPFPSSHFAAVTISFGVRNFSSLDRGLRQVASILRPGGRLIVLEFAVPRFPVVRPLYLLYLRFVLPWIGQLLSPRGSAYGYLRDSVLEFPQRREFAARLESAGFDQASWRDLSAGTVCLYSARKPLTSAP